MNTNTHPAVAKFRQEGVHEWQSDEGLTDATSIATILDAQVEASLALAHEQRTANLIAYLQLTVTGSRALPISMELPTPDPAAHIARVREAIEERLDLV